MMATKFTWRIRLLIFLRIYQDPRIVIFESGKFGIRVRYLFTYFLWNNQYNFSRYNDDDAWGMLTGGNIKQYFVFDTYEKAKKELDALFEFRRRATTIDYGRDVSKLDDLELIKVTSKGNG